MNPTLTIRVPKELRAELIRTSKTDKISLSNLVRESIQNYLALRQFRRQRGKTIPFAESRGLLTDDDVFKAIS
jgi:predicted transcriptional regulator